MAGWNLKYGITKITIFNDEYLWSRLKDFLSKKTSMQNLYKITLIRSLIYINDNVISSRNNIFTQVLYEFSKAMWDFKSKSITVNTIIYNGISYESKQDKIINETKSRYNLNRRYKFEELDVSIKLEYIKKTKSVIKTNVIGAVFSDFNGEIYSFNLRNNDLFLSG